MHKGCDTYLSWLDVLGDPIRLRTLHGLVVNGEITATELAERIAVSEAALRRHLEAIVSLGLAMERVGSSDGLTRGRPASRFALLPEVRERASRLFELLSEPLIPGRR